MTASIRRARGADGRVVARLAVVNRYSFPDRALAAYEKTLGDLDAGQREQLIAATRQWCRLLARQPDARLEQPSSAVADYWRQLEARPRDHATFCAGAFGRVPVQAGPPVDLPPAGAREAAGLHATYLLACADESSTPPRLPLLFRVDWVLDRLDAHSYVPNCGEVRYCAAGDGTICLQHLTQKPRPRRSIWGGAQAGGIGMRNSDATGGFTGVLP